MTNHHWQKNQFQKESDIDEEISPMSSLHPQSEKDESADSQSRDLLGNKEQETDPSVFSLDEPSSEFEPGSKVSFDDTSEIFEVRVNSAFDESSLTSELIAREESSDTDGIKTKLEEMFNTYKTHLLNMISCRLNPQARKLIDPNDILQETFLAAWMQYSRGTSHPQTSPLLWLRLIVRQQLAKFHERYFITQKRNLSQEVDFNFGEEDSVNVSIALSNLISKLSPPSLGARKQELSDCLQNCLLELNLDDREILSLRHFEMLSNIEAAEELGILPAAASKRYLRALQKLRKIIESKGLETFFN